MSDRRRRGDLWDGDDFEDIRSHSTGEPPQFGLFAPRESGPVQRQSRSAGEPAPSRENRSSRRRSPPSKGRDSPRERPPSGKSGQKGREKPAPKSPRAKPKAGPGGSGPRNARGSSSRPAPPAANPRKRGRPEPEPRKRRRPMSRGKRRFLMVLALLAMLAGTGFLLETILFRVSLVRVTGDAVYPEEEILKICNYKTGDNLLFIPTESREERLEKELPYIGEAKISRRIPGTVVIRITAAQAACCFQTGGYWVVTDSGGKVLETGNAPPEGLMQVTGLNPPVLQPGETMVLEDEAASAAFSEIVKAIGDLDAAQKFTRLDLGDLNNLSLWYENRVECKLGGTNELTRKVQYGYGLFNSDRPDTIGPQATGVLDLSYLPKNSRSYFSEGEVSPGSGQPSAPAQEPSGGGGQGDSPQAGGSAEPSAEPNRGSQIPDQPYTGG